MDKIPGKNRNPKPAILLFSLFPFLFSLVMSCSFDYGNANSGDKGLPDIVMDNVEYVRVRSMDPQARLQAERVERYEERRIMELRNFSFEQFGSHGEEINAHGRAGSALFEIDSGDIRMDDGVRLDVDSEDIAMETKQLEWKDKERTLTGGANEEVHVYQDNGTSFTGIGFQANARTRSWSFTETVSGTYIHDGEEEEEEVEKEKDDGDSKEAVSGVVSPNPDDDGEKEEA
jgi:LPS export ABC transporter protein LptC